MIEINHHLTINENELVFDFVKASGPGGQHVNKASTAVQLRFDVANSPSLPDDIRSRLLALAANQINKAGELVIDARRFRSQRQNQQDAVNRFIKLLRHAAKKPRLRRKTTPSRRAKERRLENKRRRSTLKKSRRPPNAYEG